MRTAYLISILIILSLCSVAQTKGPLHNHKKHLTCMRLTVAKHLKAGVENINRFSGHIRNMCLGKFGQTYKVLCRWASDAGKATADLYKEKNVKWMKAAAKRAKKNPNQKPLACEKTIAGRIGIWFWKNFKINCGHMNKALNKLDKQSIAAGKKPVIPEAFKRKLPNGKFINLVVVCNHAVSLAKRISRNAL
jgi:hypothetical protein